MKLRELIAREGAQQLTTEQLFTVIIGSGTTTASAAMIAHLLGQISHDFAQITELNPKQLQQITGIGPANLARILAVIELSQRLSATPAHWKQPTVTLPNLGTYLVREYGDLLQEQLVGVFLDVHQCVLAEKCLFRGTYNHTTVDCREVIRLALQMPCAQIIIAHNHPSNNLIPSKADREFTQNLQTCCRLFQLELLDHLILGQLSFVSLKEKGLM